MAENYIGQILQGGWNFAPRGTVMASGQLLSISQNTALYSLFGTTYGGDGTTTFGIPDLRGRTVVGTGQGPGMQSYQLGTKIGSENVTLSGQNLPVHTHAAQVSGNGTASFSVSSTKASAAVAAANGVLGKAYDINVPQSSVPAIYLPAGTTTDVPIAGMNLAGAPVTVGPAGSSTPFSVLQPLLALTCVVVLNGIFPSRN